jgi:hypothetical protein
MSSVIVRRPTASTLKTFCVHLEVEVSWPWNVGDECLVQRGRASTTTWEQLPLMTPQLRWIDLASMSWHRLIGIATRSWAIDLKVDGPATAAVYAIDRGKHGISRHAEIAELGHGEGEIPVVQFDLPEPNVEEFIRHAFKRISVHLVTQAIRDQVLVVTDPSSTPEA